MVLEVDKNRKECVWNNEKIDEMIAGKRAWSLFRKKKVAFITWGQNWECGHCVWAQESNTAQYQETVLFSHATCYIIVGNIINYFNTN